VEIKFVNRATGKIDFETPPAEGLLKFLYDNPFGKVTLLPLAKRKFFSATIGKKMNKKKSVKKINNFVQTLKIDMSESAKKISEFTSFNDFFYRKLKPEARPIGQGFVSPGDGRLLAFENVANVNTFFVKGRAFTLPEFLGDNDLAEQHKDDSMFILRLAPNDYHRFHFPYEGMANETIMIKGDYFSVSPYALVSNFTKVFCENKREICKLQTLDKGEVLLIPVGATLVGTIIETYTPESTVQIGDEMGYFAFGGSTVVIFVDKTKIQINQDLLTNTKNRLETLVKMGEQIGL
jgi:phosphatidylserine decarboxylase